MQISCDSTTCKIQPARDKGNGTNVISIPERWKQADWDFESVTQPVQGQPELNNKALPQENNPGKCSSMVECLPEKQARPWVLYLAL